jgi:hypothetical protein
VEYLAIVFAFGVDFEVLKRKWRLNKNFINVPSMLEKLKSHADGKADYSLRQRN